MMFGTLIIFAIATSTTFVATAPISGAIARSPQWNSIDDGLVKSPAPQMAVTRERDGFVAYWENLEATARNTIKLGCLHRGLFGLRHGQVVQDSAPTALQLGLDLTTLFEMDAYYDKSGQIIVTHNAHGRRQTLLNVAWKDVVFDDLPLRLREFVARKFENGQWGSEYLPLGTSIISGDELARTWLSCNPGMTILLDTKEDTSKYAIGLLQSYPHLRKRILPMVYSTHFKDVADFKRQVHELGYDPDWSEIYLTITPNPWAFSDMAGVEKLSLDHEKILEAQIAWVDGFFQEFPHTFAPVLVLGPGAELYNPETSTVEHHPEFGTLVEPEDVRPYLDQWVGGQLAEHIRRQYGQPPIFAPSNRPVLIAGGMAYVDHYQTGRAVTIESGTPKGWLFEECGKARNIFGAGANVVITEEPRDVEGREEPWYSLLTYEPRIYENFALPDSDAKEWANDANFLEI